MKYPGKIISYLLLSEFYGVLFGRASEFDLWSNGD
jgi:hypothetical protein